MGIYLNPGNQGFLNAVCSEIYVDKTGLIAYTNKCINTEQRYLCVSRPRRFGKSMTLRMLAAYYSRSCDSGALFSGFQIEGDASFLEHLNRYDVFFLNMQSFLIESRGDDLTGYLERRVIRDVKREYGGFFSEDETVLAAVLEEIYAGTGRQFLFLIDEWDCVMRERQASGEMQRDYLDFLRNLLKDRPYAALVYMTGILPVKKYGVHSALNMFTEYAMTDQKVLEEYTGFTEDEVRKLCARYDMDFAETRSWYDGYRLRKFRHICNPKSVVEAMLFQNYSSYWTSTEACDALKIYMDMDFDGLRADIVRMLGGMHVKVNTRSFQNDMRSFYSKDDVLTLLIHLGYLAFDSGAGEAFIPNREILEEFENAMSTGGWSQIMHILQASEKLLKDTLLGDEQSVAGALDKAHTEVASILTYNDENSLACAVGLAYYSARKDYRLIREMPGGKGFADLVFLPLPHTGKPALVMEFKYGRSAEAAVSQIRERRYEEAPAGFSGEILLIGISYSRKTKTHTCKIERTNRLINGLETLL